MLQQIWNNISERVSEHFEKKRQEQEEFNHMQRQAEWEQQIAMNQREREKALMSAKQDALRRARNEKGIHRLRALNRAERLSEQNPSTIFSRLSQHTQKNIKKTQENRKRNQIIRDQARRLREQQMDERRRDREMKMQRRKL